LIDFDGLGLPETIDNAISAQDTRQPTPIQIEAVLPSLGRNEMFALAKMGGGIPSSATSSQLRVLAPREGAAQPVTTANRNTCNPFEARCRRMPQQARSFFLGFQTAYEKEISHA